MSEETLEELVEHVKRRAERAQRALVENDEDEVDLQLSKLRDFLEDIYSNEGKRY